MAIVQTPQCYYNSQNFQTPHFFNKKNYCDQDSFLHTVLPLRSHWNASYWIGTNAILRRKALMSIGGFATSSVTEDVLTSMLIHAKGWKSIKKACVIKFTLRPSGFIPTVNG
jgi:cellulose synthase (UDP-forming)